MKKIIGVFLLFMIFVFPIPVFSLNLSCRSCILMDIDSGRVLYEKNSDNQQLIASTTKIMTAIVALENGNLDDKIVVGKEVLSMYGSNIYIEVGEEITLRDLLYGLMLRSGNDAAIVIATYIGGTEEKFVEMMNKKAKEIGMNNTVFSNSHGLDENTKNISTAYDMALLSSYASKNPIYLKIASTKKYKTSTNKKTYIWNNRNNLLFTYKYLTSGKTGYTPLAGRTLVTTASKENINLTAVALDDGNHYETHQKMYEYAFEKYKKYKILDYKKFKINAPFFKDIAYIKNDFYYPLELSEVDKIRVLVMIEKIDNYSENDKIGTIEVYLSGKKIFSEPVYVRIKEKDNLFNRIKRYFGIK